MCDRRQWRSVTGHWHQQAHAVHRYKRIAIHREFKSFDCYYCNLFFLQLKTWQNKQIIGTSPAVLYGLGRIFMVSFWIGLCLRRDHRLMGHQVKARKCYAFYVALTYLTGLLTAHRKSTKWEVRYLHNTVYQCPEVHRVPHAPLLLLASVLLKVSYPSCREAEAIRLFYR